jgi:hypothetical protein
MDSVSSVREVPESSKLIGDSNYVIWSYKVRTVLQSEKAWKVVNPDTSNDSPGASSSVDSGTSSISETMGKTKDASSPAAPAAPFPDLEELRHKAVRIIVATVKDALVPYIMHMIDPRDVWIKLRDLFESKSMNRRLTLKSKLYSLKMTERDIVVEHLRKVSELIGQLANIGVIVPDDELVDRVLTSLPPSWEVFRCMASNRKTPYSLSELEGRLLAEDSVCTRNKDEDESVMMAQSNFQPRFTCSTNTYSLGACCNTSYCGRVNSYSPIGRGNAYTGNFGSGNRGYNLGRFSIPP